MTNKEFVQKVKEASDIVEIVAEQVSLKRAGSRYKGLSPFANEKTPSFFVTPETQLFYCFSTNIGGDVIDFLMQTKAMGFTEALEWLANRAGIPVPKGVLGKSSISDIRRSEAQKQFLKINRFVAHYYQNLFWGTAGNHAREYALGRGLSEKTLKNFAIGFAPDSWNSLRDYLTSIQAPLKAALTLGLLKTRSEEALRADGSNAYDAFRNRLIFPIRDSQGEIIGFGGRTLDQGESVKYLNSPESPVYNKGHSLYNFDRARKHVRTDRTVVIVEGYMDCIAMDQVGFPNVVATLGTALTAHHASILCKVADRIINLYDSDAAGKNASIRNMDIFLKTAGFPIAGVILPSGKDPDEFLRAQGAEGVRILAELIKEAPALIDRWIDEQISQSPKTVQGRVDCLKKLAEKLAFLREDLWIKARISDIADRLILPVDLARETIHGLRSGMKEERKQAAAQNKGQKSTSPLQKSEKFARQNGKTKTSFETQFLRYVLLYSERLRELRDWHRKDSNIILPLLENEWIRKVLEYLLKPLDESKGETDLQRLGGLIEALDLRQEPRLKNFITKTLAESMGPIAPAALLSEALRKLHNDVQERRAQNLKIEIKQAESRGDAALLENLQRELMTLFQESKHDSLEAMNGH